ncbi:unnamed protein product [Acidithrix sp. C25]|nr:unnamed protein product [Acidithrix sp. C25]
MWVNSGVLDLSRFIGITRVKQGLVRGGARQGIDSIFWS